MYNLSLPKLCANCSSLRALRLPTAARWQVRLTDSKCPTDSRTVLCGALYTACVDASRMVFWDCSVLR